MIPILTDSILSPSGVHHNLIKTEENSVNTTLSFDDSTVAPQLAPKLVRRGQGESVEAFGQCALVQISAADTGNAIALHQVEIPALNGPPYHVHRREDEIFLVRRGCFEFIIDGVAHTAQTGDFLFAPRNVPHTFRNCEEESGVLQVLCIGGGFDSFFRQCARALAENADMGAIMNIAAAHGLVFLVPESVEFESSSPTATPRIVRGDSEAIAHDLHVGEGETQGRFNCRYQETLSCSGTPLQANEKCDNLFFIEEGFYEFQLGSARVQATAGDVVWIPRDTPHAFRVISAQNGHAIVFSMPVASA